VSEKKGKRQRKENERKMSEKIRREKSCVRRSRENVRRAGRREDVFSEYEYKMMDRVVS
jgi:hypothetical protein